MGWGRGAGSRLTSCRHPQGNWGTALRCLPQPQPSSSHPLLPFQVSLVDSGLLKFPRLEELVLSANQIKEVAAANLPPTLKVKEARLSSGL